MLFSSAIDETTMPPAAAMPRPLQLARIDNEPRRPRQHWAAWLVALTGLLGVLPGAAHGMPANESPPAGRRPAVESSGFATLGLARSSSDQAEFVRDLSQPGGIGRRWSAKIDSVVGLQSNVHVSRTLEAVGQIIARYGPEGDFRPELSWAFLRFEPVPALALRGGRIGTDFYMLADSRWVGYSYLTVRPPNDYFGALPFYSIDGGDASFTHPLGPGLLRGKAFSGLSREQAPLADRQWNLDGSRMTGGDLGYQSGAWHWRVSHARIRFRHDLPIQPLFDGLNAFAAGGIPAAGAAARALAVAGSTSHFTSLGLLVEQGPLQVHLMLNRTQHESASFQNSHGGYAVLGYRLGRWTPFAGYSKVESTPRTLATGVPENTGNPAFDGAARQINRSVAELLADSHSNQHTLSFGTRVELRPHLALKAQWDGIRGQSSSIFPYRREQPGWTGRTNITTLTLDTVF